MDPSSDGLLSVASQEEKQPASDPFAALGGSIGLMVWFVTQPLPPLVGSGEGGQDYEEEDRCMSRDEKRRPKGERQGTPEERGAGRPRGTPGRCGGADEK